MRIRNTGHDCQGFILNILYAENTPSAPSVSDPDPPIYVHAAPHPAPDFALTLEEITPLKILRNK
jgi:hypothetical protein